MRRIIYLAFVISVLFVSLVSCMVFNSDIDEANMICKEHGGIHRIYVRATETNVVCQDGYKMELRLNGESQKKERMVGWDK
jgi:hypothetical protein